VSPFSTNNTHVEIKKQVRQHLISHTRGTSRCMFTVRVIFSLSFFIVFPFDVFFLLSYFQVFGLSRKISNLLMYMNILLVSL